MKILLRNAVISALIAMTFTSIYKASNAFDAKHLPASAYDMAVGVITSLLLIAAVIGFKEN